MELNAYDDQFGRRLAHARQDAGLTLQELAERVGWYVSTLHNYESGRRPLKVAQLAQLAAALNSLLVGFLSHRRASQLPRPAMRRGAWVAMVACW